MATTPSSPLQLSNSFPFPLPRAHHQTLHAPKSAAFVSTKATESDTTASEESDSIETPQTDTADSFENRLSQVRLRYRSGTGKKAEVRKGRKSKKSSTGTGVFLPPVPLKEPTSGGLKVDFGFTPYSERINGRIATLGLSALLLVELATGKSVINYHSPAIVFIQIYFVAAVSAMYVKYQKERVSVWP